MLFIVCYISSLCLFRCPIEFAVFFPASKILSHSICIALYLLLYLMMTCSLNSHSVVCCLIVFCQRLCIHSFLSCAHLTSVFTAQNPQPCLDHKHGKKINTIYLCFVCVYLQMFCHRSCVWWSSDVLPL